MSSLLQFVGDNIGIFSEEDFRHLVCLQDKMQSDVFDAYKFIMLLRYMQKNYIRYKLKFLISSGNKHGAYKEGRL